MYKTVKDEGKKHKDLIVVIPIMPCQNPLWIMGSGEGKTQIPLSSPTTIDSQAQDPE